MLTNEEIKVAAEAAFRWPAGRGTVWGLTEQKKYVRPQNSHRSFFK